MTNGRACSKVITVVNRSEVVGRPLAALLANDGARVFSVDIDSVVEFSKRPTGEAKSKFNAHHVSNKTDNTLEQCLAISDVVISAVPSDKFKVPTAQLKDGCVCVNVAGEKNFEADVRERVSPAPGGRAEPTGRGEAREGHTCPSLPLLTNHPHTPTNTPRPRSTSQVSAS